MPYCLHVYWVQAICFSCYKLESLSGVHSAYLLYESHCNTGCVVITRTLREAFAFQFSRHVHIFNLERIYLLHISKTSILIFVCWGIFKKKVFKVIFRGYFSSPLYSDTVLLHFPYKDYLAITSIKKKKITTAFKWRENEQKIYKYVSNSLLRNHF